MAQIHEYPVTVQWNGGHKGTGVCDAGHSGLHLKLAVPAEFGGTGEGTNPEELLTSAIASCYSITFGIIASMRKLPFNGLQVEAVGEVEQPNAATFIYNKITIRPTIHLAAEATDEQVKMAEDMSHKADLYCIITSAVRDKVKVIVEPTIVKG